MQIAFEVVGSMLNFQNVLSAQHLFEVCRTSQVVNIKEIISGVQSSYSYIFGSMFVCQDLNIRFLALLFFLRAELARFMQFPHILISRHFRLLASLKPDLVHICCFFLCEFFNEEMSFEQ
ncbi:hypothetical protein BHE74_00037003 [Ensete ventricosum]|nr:hypothetical protein BHE74_00037003 [Ensete ventricosum]